MTETAATQLALFPVTPTLEPDDILEGSRVEIDDQDANASEPLFVDVALAELDRVCTDIRDTIAAAPEVLLAQSLLLTEAILTARAAEVGEVEIAQRLAGLFDRKPRELVSQPPKRPRRYMTSLYPFSKPKNQPKTKTYLRRYRVY